MAFLESFRTVRWIRTINLALQAILVLTLFGGLNYLSRSYSWRYDLTQHRRYSLSPETLAYLANLQRPVRIIVTLTDDSDNADVAQAYRDISGLLREYAYETERSEAGRVTIEHLDVYIQRREAEQLGIEQANVVLILCGDQRRIVTIEELYRNEKGVKTAFQGEQTITAAILDVSNPVKKKIYFLAGHGELDPSDVDPTRGLSALHDELRLRNFMVDRVDLGISRKIPDDAALLVAAAPIGPYEPAQQELLRQYLSAGAGRLILLLSPEIQHGLDNLLLDWGVLADDVVVRDNNQASFADNGDFILKPGDLQPHPITQNLINYNISLRLGSLRTVRPDPGRSTGGGLTVATLATTSTTAWGDLSYRIPRAHEFKAGVDLQGAPWMEPPNRLGIAVASERIGVRDNLPFSVPTGRLVVIGTGDIVSNSRIVNTGNENFFLGAVNWAVDRDTQLNVPARPIERYQLSLNQKELLRLRYSMLLILPGAAALLGLIVYWTRRR